MLNEKPEPTKEEEEKNQRIAKMCSLIRTNFIKIIKIKP